MQIVFLKYGDINAPKHVNKDTCKHLVRKIPAT